MWLTVIKTVAATAVFGAWHSLLAGRHAKAAAARWLGTRHRNGLYRLFYLAQSVLTLAALAAYLRRLPDRLLYTVPAPWRWLLHVGQAAGLGWAVWAAATVGLSRILGLSSSWAWLHAKLEVPPEPEAQGPALGPDGRLLATGPFRLSRHPLNLAPLGVFWLWPRMTVKLLAFNLASTAYLVIGSWHEEARLRRAYGPLYEQYLASGAPFYLPWPG
jgi:protein-S-isoprenylcysteine O-methyltransferase Ste14